MGTIKLIICNQFKQDLFLVSIGAFIVIAMKSYERDKMELALSLIKGCYSMKNRCLLLCLKNNIETVHDYAKLMNITDEYAEDVLKENAVLTDDVISRSCELFNVSKEYLLCEI